MDNLPASTPKETRSGKDKKPVVALASVSWEPPSPEKRREIDGVFEELMKE